MKQTDTALFNSNAISNYNKRRMQNLFSYSFYRNNARQKCCDEIILNENLSCVCVCDYNSPFLLFVTLIDIEYYKFIINNETFRFLPLIDVS